MRVYLTQNVEEALYDRLNLIFDKFRNIIVSVSGGKDSTVLFNAAMKIAKTRGRQIHLFFLDQEAEYQSTIDQVRYMAKSYDGIVNKWVQVPIFMTNSTSYEVPELYAWGENEEWIREKELNSIHHLEGYPKRFYPFLEWFESQWNPQDSCFLVGLRADESLHRLSAVTRNPAYENLNWSSKGKNDIPIFYPLYDFTFEDVWHYITLYGLRYNKIYDWQFVKNVPVQSMRVSNLIHEKSFHCLNLLQEFEPETFDRLCKRLKGVHMAGIYAQDSLMNNSMLPPKFKTWRAYRDFLLHKIPDPEKFKKRFFKQGNNEETYKRQVRQLLLNDWENNLPIFNVDIEKRKEKRQKWANL